MPWNGRRREWNFGRTIKLHLDDYIQQFLRDDKEYIKKTLRPKKVPVSPGDILKSEGVPEDSEPGK
jgi:hypothetical protein